MGWKGFIRSYSAAVRRSEREQQRRTKEAARQYKQLLKEQEIHNAAEAVKQYEDYLDVIKSIHKDCSDFVDWESIIRESQPEYPSPVNNHHQIAQNKLSSFKPSIIDKLFGQTNKKIQKLENEVEKAEEKDKQEYLGKLKEYEKELADWNSLQKIAKGIFEKEPTAYKEAIEFFNPFSDVSTLGSKMSVEFKREYVEVDLHVNDDEIIPKFVLSQNSNGKLSKKTMPISRFNEVYQDYVCGCVLRLVRETLAYLPVKFVVVNALGDLLNSSTGQLEEQIILSVAFSSETIEKLNFDTLDPSDSMKNFKHKMKFTKTNGFQAVEKVNIEAIEK